MKIWISSVLTRGHRGFLPRPFSRGRRAICANIWNGHCIQTWPGPPASFRHMSRARRRTASLSSASTREDHGAGQSHDQCGIAAPAAASKNPVILSEVPYGRRREGTERRISDFFFGRRRCGARTRTKLRAASARKDQRFFAALRMTALFGRGFAVFILPQHSSSSSSPSPPAPPTSPSPLPKSSPKPASAAPSLTTPCA